MTQQFTTGSLRSSAGGLVPGRAALSCSKHAGVSFRECLDENKWVSNKGRGNRNVVKLCEEAIKVTSL